MAERSSANLKSHAGHWVFVDEALGPKSYDNPTQTEISQSPKRHPEFFFDNTLVVIQIEDTLFNVHRYQLAKSEVFSDMFKLPKPEGDEPVEGSSPEYPIKLQSVSALDFAALLRVLYASQFSDEHLAPEASLIIPAFRLANMFNFSKLRAHLLPLAEENLDDVDKIVFAREFDIKNWLAPAHIRLCTREAVLSDDEASKLGVRSAVMICRMREQHRSQSRTPISKHAYCQNCAGWRYCGRTNFKCQDCQVNATDHYLYYNGPGTMGAGTSTNDTAIETEVKKWVEDDYAVRVK